MSCHDIGRGMNSVTRVVIKMFDNGELSREAALKLLMALKLGVHWCDGNEYEAVASILDCRCGKCLKKIEEDENFYDIYECSPLVAERPMGILDNYNENYAGYFFCKDCFDNIIKAITNGKITGEVARKYIDEREN